MGVRIIRSSENVRPSFEKHISRLQMQNLIWSFRTLFAKAYRKKKLERAAAWRLAKTQRVVSTVLHHTWNELATLDAGIHSGVCPESQNIDEIFNKFGTSMMNTLERRATLVHVIQIISSQKTLLENICHIVSCCFTESGICKYASFPFIHERFISILVRKMYFLVSFVRERRHIYDKALLLWSII